MRRLRERVSKVLDTRFYNILDFTILLLVSISVIVFILWPVVSVVKRSFFPNGAFTIDLYKNILTNNKKLLINSMFVATLSTLLSTFIAVIIAIYSSFAKEKTRKIISLILMLSMISPPFVGSLAYIQLFGKRGFITYRLLKLSINPYGWQGIVIMQSLSMTALSALMLISIIKGIDKKVLSASLDLGASKVYTVRKVLLPLMAPGIIVCALLTFIRALSDFGTPMTIGGSFNVIATEIYMRIIGYGDLNLSAAMNVLILIPALIIFIIYRFTMKKYNSLSKGVSRVNGADDTFTLDKGVFKMFLKVVTYIYAFMMLSQYFVIFLSSITKYKGGKMYFTFENIKELNKYGMDTFVRSVVYALIAGVVGTIIGVLLSYYVERRNIVGMKIIDFISTLPYIIPGTFFGIGYILAFNNKPLELTGTALIVVLNCIFKQLPMATKAASANLAQINRDIEQGAKDLGATNVHVIKDVILPNMRPAFLTGFVNNFTTTMTTVGSIIFLIYPGQKVATVQLFDAINSGNIELGSLIATILIIIILTVNLLFAKVIMGGKNVSTVKEFNQGI